MGENKLLPPLRNILPLSKSQEVARTSLLKARSVSVQHERGMNDGQVARALEELGLSILPAYKNLFGDEARAVNPRRKETSAQLLIASIRQHYVEESRDGWTPKQISKAQKVEAFLSKKFAVTGSAVG